MVKLLIAEKPSVARDIARVVGARTRHEGYLEGGGYRVSWCVGHLLELIEPHEYDAAWKSWSAKRSAKGKGRHSAPQSTPQTHSEQA